MMKMCMPYEKLSYLFFGATEFTITITHTRLIDRSTRSTIIAFFLFTLFRWVFVENIRTYSAQPK